MEIIPVEEAQRRLPELLERAAAGERIAIGSDDSALELVASKLERRPNPERSFAKVCAEGSHLIGDIEFVRDPSPGRPLDL